MARPGNTARTTRRPKAMPRDTRREGFFGGPNATGRDPVLRHADPTIGTTRDLPVRSLPSRDRP
ncbi:MAG: hypothetical protein ACK528_13895 [Alphaproteobacteria bacterium]